MIKQLITTTRPADWWEHKLTPMLATGFATAFLLGEPLLRSWSAFLLALVAVIPGAAYVSLVNDLTDLGLDRAAGKYNRLEGHSRALATAAAAGCLAVGWAIALLGWRGDGLALAVYAGAWIAFSAYSIPPVRLKARGFAGVLADAAGAHLFPTLLIVVLVFVQQGRPVIAWWLVLVGAWALLCGVRGILWHQLGDVSADRKMGLRTFGVTHTRRARLLEVYLLFPCEVLLFCTILIRAHNLLAVALLPIYALYLLRARACGAPIVVVSQPPGDHKVVMHDYYVVLYPMAFLIAAAVRHPPDALMIVIYLALFPRMFTWIAVDMARKFGSLVGQLLTARRKLIGEGLRAAIRPAKR